MQGCYRLFQQLPVIALIVVLAGRYNSTYGESVMTKAIGKWHRSAAVSRELDDEQLAVDRVGASPEANLRWVLTFIERDLNKTRREERIALGYDLRQLLPIGWAVSRVQGEPISDRVLRRIHRTAGENIRALLADDRATSPLVDTTAGWALPSGRGRDRLVRLSPKGAKVALFEIARAPSDDETAILRGIADLIVRAGGRLRLCARLDCGKPFWAVKRQQYCSVACSQRVRNQTKALKKSERARRR